MTATARGWTSAAQRPGPFAGLYFVAATIDESEVMGVTVATWTGSSWKTTLKVTYWRPIEWPEPPAA